METVSIKEVAISEKEKEMEAVKKLNIYERIGAVSYEVGRVQMSLDVATKTDKMGNTLKSYKALSINDVADALIPLLAKYRLVIVPDEKEILFEEQIKTTSSYGEKTQFFVRMRARYKVVNIDKPEEFVTADGYGDGIDSGDKALGKANTYARKYALIDIFNLSKGDDPDEKASEEYKPIEYATAQQIAKVNELYTADEMAKMLKRLKKSNPSELTKEQAEKMILKRDMSLVASQVNPF